MTQPGASASPAITVVITTYNRKDELGLCLDSVLKQDYPCEVLVMDDASSDGTTEYVREHYPQVRVERSEQNVGLIGQRTRAGEIATGEVVVSIDDDVEMVGEDTLSLVAAAFDSSDIACVTFPSIDLKTDATKVHTRPPSDDRRWAIGEYRGCAHALRRRVFLDLGAYDKRLYRQGEETDLTARLYAAGYLIAMAETTPIHHHESPRRKRWIEFYFGPRNAVIFCWWRVPWRLVPVYLAVRTLNHMKSGVRSGFPWSTIRGLLAGHWVALTSMDNRGAPSYRAYKIYEKLRRGGPAPLEEVRQELRDAGLDPTE